MTTRRVAGLVGLGLVLAAAAGCGNRGTDELLAGAHASLVQGDLPGARNLLEGAEGGLESDRQHKEFELLSAEVDVRAGNPELARPVIDGLLDAYPDDPRVHEMAGKVALAEGEFGEAGVQFGIAAGRYKDAGDVARAGDLVALAKGLNAYAAGRIAEAREHWTAIKDRTLRSSVLSAAGEPDEPTTLAQSGQPNP